MGEGKGLRGGKDHMSKGMEKGVHPTGVGLNEVTNNAGPRGHGATF